MVYAALNIAFRRRFDDAGSRTWTNEDIAVVIDEAAKWLQGELNILRNRTSLSVVLDQRQYTLPSTVLKPLEMDYMDASGGHKIHSCSPDEFRAQSRMIVRASIPNRYTLLENEGVILLNPIPMTAAHTTTLNGGINSSVTTLTVLSTSNFPGEGRVIVDSEVISYTNKTATTLTGCVRGEEGTTAATHTDLSVVTERDLVIWGARQWTDFEMRRYYNTGTVTMTNASTAVVGATTLWDKGNIAVGDYIGISSDATTTLPMKWYKIATITDDTHIVLSTAYAEPTAATQNYIISSPNPFPSYCDGALIAYAGSILLKRTGAMDRAGAEFASAMRQLESVRKNNRKTDTLMYPHSFRESGQVGRMRVWTGDTLTG